MAILMVRGSENDILYFPILVVTQNRAGFKIRNDFKMLSKGVARQGFCAPTVVKAIHGEVCARRNPADAGHYSRSYVITRPPTLGTLAHPKTNFIT